MSDASELRAHLRAPFSDAQVEEVWRGVTSILSRDLPGHGERRASPEEPAFKRTRSVRWRLPADLGRRYAAVSGDYNPIHWRAPWPSSTATSPRPSR